MASSCIGWTPLLLCLVQLLHFHTHAASTSSSSFHAHGHSNLTHHPAPSLCPPDQANTLLKLKQSFLFTTTTLPSWQAGTDCCLWEGVGCSSNSSLGHVVTALDLSGFGLNSFGIDPVLFNLTSLRLLDLSMNDFRGYDISSLGFERLSSLTHLNLSTSGIGGQVPIGISKLTNLVSLDLSDHSADTEDLDDDYDVDVISGAFNDLSLPYFHNIVANLSNLTELYLDSIGISSSVEDGFKALAKYVPHLRVLSLQSCGLHGHIDSSLSRFKSLSVINLSGNSGITPGPFPEFLMNLPNLRVLQLSGINLQGWFPRGMFLSKNLSLLDLSGNPDLSGHLPSFSNAVPLETLWIDSTNFSYDKSSYHSDFKSLTELAIDGEIISTNFHSSFGMLASLCRLTVSGLDSPRQLESLFSWLGGIKNLRTLSFIDCDLSMTIPSSIGNLRNLTSLIISESYFTTQTLSSITNIRNLKIFEINCGHNIILAGKLPYAIGNMSNLEKLGISAGCQLSGPIPHEVGTLKKLKSLVLPSVGLSGRIPSTISNLTQLTKLQLEFNYLSGRIPSTIYNLTQLTELRLRGNHLSGEIPPYLFTLPKLGYLDLSENQLSGPIHEFDGAFSCLRIVYLEMNNLSGQIPQSLLVLPNLTKLNIEGNNLMGSVDLASLWGEKLTILDLSYNNLTVVEGDDINNSSTYPHQLMELGLACCNMKKIPKLLMHAKYVTYLDISRNKISGDIPSWIWDRWSYSLKWINLSDNMFTGMELDSYVIPFSNTLDSFNLSFNRLQGSIPMPNSSAIFLDYSNNSFSSLLPNFTIYLRCTLYLGLSNNNISGFLPHSICDSPLTVLDLSCNKFSGPLPRCLMEKGYLSIISLRENQFNGMLPSSISINCAFETIDLSGNKIEGKLPRALSNCSNLEVLDLGRNRIADTFPNWLGGLLNLRVLILRSNKFHGSIGHLEDEKYIGHFSSLQIIDLASNNFSGKMQPQWFENLKSMRQQGNSGQIIEYHPTFWGLPYQDHSNTGLLYQDSITISYKGFDMTFVKILTTLTAIDLSDNALEGSIPTSIGDLFALHVLNMSHNAFTGKIPPQLGSITFLESLDLSSNMLSGEIPQELTDLTFLGTLNLSNNQLDGRIPQSRQFATFQNSSFDGNAGLCGPPLSKKCDPSDIPSETHLKNSSHGVDVVLFLFSGVGFGVGFAAAILLKLDYWISKWFHIFTILC